MKKLCVIILSLLLTGCGSAGAAIDSIQTQYGQIQTAQMEAKVVCHLENESRTYTLSCTCEETGASTTVTAPEELKGITASVTPDGLTVTYDGTSMSAGELRDICPANCLPYLLAALSNGYLMEQGTEEWNGIRCYRLMLDTTAESGQKVVCTVWLNEETLIPQYAEFTQEEKVVLSAEMLAFSCTLSES